MIKTDSLVLGAGMVGISTALHLQQRGRDVVLLDRRGPAEEASHGNAGLIQREGVLPYGFPRSIGEIFRYALNRATDAHYHLSALPKIAPALFRYWQYGTPEKLLATAKANRPLIERCLVEHEALMQAAGVVGIEHRDGWLKLYRTPKVFEDAARSETEAARQWGYEAVPVDAARLRAMEPHLAEAAAGAIHMTQPWSVTDPGALGKAYCDLFQKRGGRFLSGDARTLEQVPEGWRAASEAGPVTAREVVVALGAWTGAALEPFGYRFPMFVKRGYHMHYRPNGNATLTHPVLDAETGYMLAPMARGVRLTTGAEFSTVEAVSTPVQLARCEPVARKLFPLGERADNEIWMGRRPCLPDLLPIIGPAQRHKGLWLHFGHHHKGFTLGPTTGRLIAEMIAGETPFTDPTPYRADRFA